MNKLSYLAGFTLLMFIGCSGQGPADIKNSTRTELKVPDNSCSEIKIDHRPLNHSNITSIFKCTGWTDKYPNLYKSLMNTSSEKMNNVLDVLNGAIFSSKEKQKIFFDQLAIAYENGQMDSISKLSEQAVKKKENIFFLERAIKGGSLSNKQKESLMKFVSKDSATTVRYLNALKAVFRGLELHREEIKRALQKVSRKELNDKIVLVVDDFSNEMELSSWMHLSKVIYDKDSAIRTWTKEGLESDHTLLLDIIERESFFKDVNFLNDSLSKRIECSNFASSRDFFVDINHDLALKVESLKKMNQEEFEKVILHSLTSYLSFQEFCGEEKKSKQLKSFYKVLGYVFELIPSTHDFNFFKSIHDSFGKDRFIFIKFLTSRSFYELRDLFIKVKQDGSDKELVYILYKITSELTDEELKTMAELARDISKGQGQTYDWYASALEFWRSLEQSEKLELISWLNLLTLDEVSLSKVVDFIITTMVNNPELSKAVFENFPKADFQHDLLFLSHVSKDEQVKIELAHFLSDNGIFEILRIISKHRVHPPAPIGNQLKTQSPSTALHETYIGKPDKVQIKNQVRTCYMDLSRQYESNPQYHLLVNQLSTACQRVLPDVGYVGQIYLWMYDLNKLFEEKLNVDDFHSSTGLWSVEMLHSLFSAGIVANDSISSPDGRKGVRENLDEIYYVLGSKYIQNSFHYFANVYERSVMVSNWESRIQNILEEKTDSEISGLVLSLIDLNTTSPDKYKLSAITHDCKTLNNIQGANPCMHVNHLRREIPSMLRILKRKNDKGISLIQEFIRWTHPSGGVILSKPGGIKKRYTTDIKEIITYLRDLSDPSTLENFDYVTVNNIIHKTRGTSIDRLEVLLREIAFENSFYGAFFKNEVAMATNYKKKIKDSNILLKLLQNGSLIMTELVGLDEDAVWKLKNIRNTYSSLSDVGKSYLQNDGTYKSYDNFIQSLLVAIQRSSKIETQDFTAYQKPDGKLAEGHNGIFLTKFVELSGLRHMALYVKNRFDTLKALDTPEFIQINNNLISKMDLRFNQRLTQNLLDNYFDNDRNQINLLVDDALLVANSMSNEEMALLESAILKTLLVASHPKIDARSLEYFLDKLDVIISSWPEIREILLQLDNTHEVLKLINKTLDSWLAHPEDLSRILKFVAENDLVNSKELKAMLLDKELCMKISQMLKHFVFEIGPKSDLNWPEVLKLMFARKDFKWKPILNWLNVAMDQKPDKKLTVSVLIHMLNQKKGSDLNFKVMIDEVFINHRKDFEYFMENVFPSLQIKD